MAEETKERKSIKVASAASPRTVQTAGGDRSVIQFKGSDEVVYEAWGKELVELIKKDADLDAEVTHTTKDLGSGPQPVHRVTQIYIDGKPARPTTRATRTGSWGKSAEQVAIERISIEGQTAYNGIIELIKADKIDLKDVTAVLALDWAKTKLAASLVPQKPEVPKETKRAKAEPPAVTPPPEPEPTEAAKIDKDTLHKLADVINKDYDQTAVQAYVIRTYRVSTLKDLTLAQGKELLDKLTSGTILVKKTAAPLF